jgi:preprotein translocase subunit SecE
MTNVFFQTATYKPSQGRIARQSTFGAVAGIIGLGAWRFSALQESQGAVLAYAIPVAILVAGIWFGFRLVHWPKFADFLIGVEAEMNKVSWPTRSELFRASMVVMVTIFVMAVALSTFDFLWFQVFQLLDYVWKLVFG